MGASPDQAKSDKRQNRIPTASAVLRDGSLVELMYRPDERSTCFAIYRDGGWSTDREVSDGGEGLLVPFSPDNNLIRTEAVVLPSEPMEYGTEAGLLSEVTAFIRRYVDFSPGFETLAANYVLFTWLYDAFNEVPYLRLRGDFGTGKTRALLTLGSLCYKAFFASGASTVSPIFHVLNAFGGTLIFDEADFRFSDERAEIVKVLNNGNVRGLPVLRTMMNRQREFNPQAFQVFGPKIVATRGNYEDKGLESRFITEAMGGRRMRDDIPINLPPSFKDEARELRNKLLLYRFRKRADARIREGLIEPSLEPRMNQIYLPLLSVITDSDQRDALRSIAFDAQARLLAERGVTPEAQVLEILAELIDQEDRSHVTVAALAAAMVERYGAEHDRPITNRWIGSILRKRLGLMTYKSHGVYVVSASERTRIELLCARYGVEVRKSGPVSTMESGDVGTSGTS
jgi:hypothetical protein